MGKFDPTQQVWIVVSVLLAIAGIFWGMHRGLCHVMTRRLEKLSAQHKRDWFDLLPNYTSSCFRITLIWCGLFMVPVGLAVLAGGSKGASGLGIVILSGMCVGATVVAFLHALTGFYIENRLIAKLSGKMDAVALGSAGTPATIVRPFWPWLYNLVGKRARHWPHYLRETNGELRLAIITAGAASVGKGVLLDTWPKLVTPSLTVFWVGWVVSQLVPGGGLVFFLYCVPLFTKNVFFPAEPEAPAKAA